VRPKNELEQLEIEMKSVADVLRKDETTKMANGVFVVRDTNNNRQRTFKTQLTEPVDLALNN